MNHPALRVVLVTCAIIGCVLVLLAVGGIILEFKFIWQAIP